MKDMAKVRLFLDTRKSAKSSITGLYPVAIRLFHRKTRIIRLLHYTSPTGWDERTMRLKKSVVSNKNIDCDKINESIYDQLHIARKLILDLGESINSIDSDMLVVNIKKAWDKKIDTKIRQEIDNGLTLS